MASLHLPFIAFLGLPRPPSPEPMQFPKPFWPLLWSVVLCNSTKLTINCVSSRILSQYCLRVCGDFCPKHPPGTHSQAERGEGATTSSPRSHVGSAGGVLRLRLLGEWLHHLHRPFSGQDGGWKGRAVKPKAHSVFSHWDPTASGRLRFWYLPGAAVAPSAVHCLGGIHKTATQMMIL